MHDEYTRIGYLGDDAGDQQQAHITSCIFRLTGTELHRRRLPRLTLPASPPLKMTYANAHHNSGYHEPSRALR